MGEEGSTDVPIAVRNSTAVDGKALGRRRREKPLPDP
jgi:hypothetical protein